MHGRSGLVVACLLCNIFNLNSQESLNYTTKCHSNRKNMRDRWRKLGAPQSFNQKKFVYKLFDTLIFYKNNKNNNLTYGLSMFSEHSIQTELGVFINIFEAYSKKIENYSSENGINLDKIDDKIKLKLMSDILKIKINKYSEIKNNILNSGLKKIVYFCKYDDFWGSGVNSIGKNYLGKLLVKIRNEYFDKYFNN
jgi:hypothetical protein